MGQYVRVAMPVTVLWCVIVGVIPGAGPQKNTTFQNISCDTRARQTTTAFVEQFDDIAVCNTPFRRIVRMDQNRLAPAYFSAQAIVAII